jgi:PH (Pleckstrin Homology) domain-containing protein
VADDIGPAQLRWRVSPRLTVMKVVGAVVFLLAGLLFLGDPVRVGFAVVAGLVVAGYAVRDVLVPVRVAADPGGVTVVTEFAGRRHLGWAEIERIRVDERQRLGTRSQLLEIDAGESLHLFSAYELNAPVDEVAAALEELRAGATS